MFNAFQAVRRCGTCHKLLKLEKFPKLHNGAYGLHCGQCKPPVDTTATFEFLAERRVSTPCCRCNGELVFWYRPTDNKLCDVFKFAEEGYRVPYLKRLLTQLDPKCEKCASSEVVLRSIQLIRQASGYKAKAMREKDPAKKAKHWRSFFRCVARSKVVAEAEAQNEQPEVEAKPEWETSRYGGLDEI